jgi:energy-coupling factor transporter ATP-binding protein EcfA2
MLRLEGLGYTYPSATSATLTDVNLRLTPGTLTLLTGPSGCGKSTLLRLAAGLSQRHGQGRVTGRAVVAGGQVEALAPAERARRLAFVSQEPGDQLLTGTLGDELAFGMESAGFDPAEINAALVPALLGVGLPGDPERSTRALSGGQAQRLVVAAAMVAGAKLLLLDEPLAMLDPAGAVELMRQLRAACDAGAAALLVEHRLEQCLPYADRLVILGEDGVVLAQGAAQPLSPALEAAMERLGLDAPQLWRLGQLVHPTPVDSLRRRAGPTPPPTPVLAPSGPPALRAGPLRHRYDRAAPLALDVSSLQLYPGERVALVGGNGAGKSTLLLALRGALAAGPVSAPGRIVHVPQDPDLSLVCETVAEELALGPAEAGLSGEALMARVQRAASDFGVEGLLHMAPQALSRGQRQRVAVAAAVATAPAVLALDEPTAGQDSASLERLMVGLRAFPGALLFATHDLRLTLRHATRAIVMVDGKIVRDAPTQEALRDLSEPSPLPLPPLAQLCVRLGLPPMEPEALVTFVERGP